MNKIAAISFSIACALCDGTAHLKEEERDFKFRGEDLKVAELFYKCDKCEQEFTTSATDEITIGRIHEKHADFNS